tara:strand:- start:3 stop:263 length:261 start_codon:yes stop_codon:yes gene_type:complete
MKSIKQYDGGGVDPEDKEMLDILEEQELRLYLCTHCVRVYPKYEMCKGEKICADCSCAIQDEKFLFDMGHYETETDESPEPQKPEY